MQILIDIPKHHYENIKSIDSVSLGRIPYKGIIMYSINAIKNGVVQEHRKGHWILADVQSKEDTENDNYRYICSECQCSDIHAKSVEVPYCWKCGAMMTESENKE